MPEFLVHMEFTFPPTMTPEEMQTHYTTEANHAKELADAGVFKRVWRIPGHLGHIALYECENADELHSILLSWPMFMYMKNEVTALAVNHNDPGGVAEELPDIKFNYDTLRFLLNLNGGHGEHGGYDLGEGISIHDHPGTDRPAQIHVMCDGQKIAEIGPPYDYVDFRDGKESVVPGYIDFLAEWQGRPVRHVRWQERIKRDNNLVHASYDDAVKGTRYSRTLIRGQ